MPQLHLTRVAPEMFGRRQDCLQLSLGMELSRTFWNSIFLVNSSFDLHVSLSIGQNPAPTQTHICNEEMCFLTFGERTTCDRSFLWFPVIFNMNTGWCFSWSNCIFIGCILLVLVSGAESFKHFNGCRCLWWSCSALLCCSLMSETFQ